ncbi:MAG: hypothetical protein KC800_24335 [Candidatus Eremiobacteraeota bacterium]|nr:hypothetical protein [Candidatus Eremiobacteraeota bacterium]
MRRSRGNIILTALFISIFLFFLSVALIWTNRQDISLSLSMEHKLKAQSAAKSAAYEAFYRLRRHGDLEGFQQGTLSSGAEYDIQLVTLEPLAKRGKVLLVRARGKSGPVTSYLTLHLLDTRIAGVSNENDSRVLLFPSAAAAPTAEGGETEPTETESETTGQALFGDFEVTEGGPGLVAGVKANEGPVFYGEETTVEPAAFLDYPAVYGGPFLRTWGPVAVVAPEYPTQTGYRATRLRHLEYDGKEFDWELIDAPEELGDEPPEGVTDVYRMAAPDNSLWTNGSVLAKNVWTGIEFESRIVSFNWTVEEPPARDKSDLDPEVEPPATNPEPVGNLIDWGMGGARKVQQQFQTRGAIYAVKQSVYSHGWHQLYQPHDGSFPFPPGFLDGSTLTRWPCILKYTIDKGWEKAWTGLKEDGSVESEIRPDPTVLAVTSTGVIYTVTEPEEKKQRRLVTINGRSIKVGDPVPDGQLIVYEDRPYLVPLDTTQPPLINLLSDDDSIDFESLPQFLPELYGEVVDVTGTEMLILGMEGGYQGEPLDSSKRLSYTAMPRYEFRYTLDPTSQIAVDGPDLWAMVRIELEEMEPTYEKGYVEGPFPVDKKTKIGKRTALARYDGERWHIMPAGLRATLKSQSLSAPGAGVVAAIYPGLPKQVSRYSIISVDTNPF